MPESSSNHSTPYGEWPTHSIEQAPVQQAPMPPSAPAQSLNAHHLTMDDDFLPIPPYGSTKKASKATTVKGSSYSHYTDPNYGQSEKNDFKSFHRKARQPKSSLDKEMEAIDASTEPLLEISAKVMEKKANTKIGEKLGRATARYCDKMMEYFEDEGFTREESLQLLCSMIRNGVTTG